jgi:hypothetical protein
MTTTDSSIERREHERFPCSPPLKASFASSEGSFSAFVEDISSAGARLRIPYSNQRIPFLLQGEREYTFHSEKSDAQYRGKTAWIQRVKADFVWGIEFINTGENADDRRGVSIGKGNAPFAAM